MCFTLFVFMNVSNSSLMNPVVLVRCDCRLNVENGLCSNLMVALEDVMDVMCMYIQPFDVSAEEVGHAS